MSKEKRLFGLVGKNISHSFSPGYFNKKFLDEGINAGYVLFDLDDIKEIESIISKNPELEGFNVTIPYKNDIFPFLDELDETAKVIGAVNVVKIQHEGDKVFLKGFNTDATGFRDSLLPLIVNKTEIKALVFGTGGASKAVKYVLNELNIEFNQVSRKKTVETLTYNDITGDVMKEYRLLINTTPLGMHPDVNSCPDIPYENLTPNHILYDLIYNPLETLFLKKGKEKGATTKNGLEMLHLQAEAAWKIWNK